jgi:dihydrofolate reductase
LRKIIIAAIAENGVIGNKGAIPWHSKEDFKHFKNTTMGFPIIMGRKCFESLGKPLTGRLNVVISRNQGYNPGGDAVLVRSVEESFLLCSERNYEKAFIIGGGEIYRQSISEADEMIISKMKLNVEGDAYFPEIDAEEWKTESETDMGEFIVIHYVRIKK